MDYQLVDIALLEQSGVSLDRLSVARHRACVALGIHHRRLVWRGSASSQVDWEVVKPGLTWSEGRDKLYEIASHADYFVFIDDDILIAPRQLANLMAPKSRSRRVELWPLSVLFLIQVWGLIRLKAYLSKKEAMTGCLYSRSDWAHKWHPKALRGSLRKREAFPVAAHDLQTHFFRSDVARQVFPGLFPGSEGSMWFAQLLGRAMWPQSQACVTLVEAFNTRHEPHSDRELPHFEALPDQLRKTSTVIREPFKALWPETARGAIDFFRAANRDLFPSEISSSKVDPEAAWKTVFDTRGTR